MTTKTRYVKVKFWSDPWIRKLDPEGKLFYLYLMTNHRTNLAGIYEITLEEMAFETAIKEPKLKQLLRKFGTPERLDFRKKKDEKKPSFDEVARADDELARANYEVARIIYKKEWICLTRFIDHQADNPKIIKGIERCLEGVPEWAKTFAMDRLSKLRYIDSYNSTLLNRNGGAISISKTGKAPDRLSPKNKDRSAPLFSGEDEEESEPEKPPAKILNLVPKQPDPEPVRFWLEAFPDLELSDEQKAVIVEHVDMAKPEHKAAWEITKIRYKGNQNRKAGKYLPERIGNVVKTFADELKRLEEAAQNGTTKPKGRRSTKEILDESAEFYRSYGTGKH